jgi:hypothetical protein
MMDRPEMEAGDDITRAVAHLALILAGAVDEEDGRDALTDALVRIEQLACQTHDDAVCLIALTARILSDWAADCEKGYLTDGKEAAYIWAMLNKALSYLLANPPLEPAKNFH